MKICTKCNTEHEKRGTFCSRKCGNSRQWSLADRELKSLSIKNYIKNNPEWLMEMKTSMPERITKMSLSRNEKTQKQFLGGLIKDAKTLKKWLIRNGTVYICNICEMAPIWNREPLTLQLDHIDGNSKNNLPVNLRLVCPNCHSQTVTYSGKNIKLIKERQNIG